MDLISICYVRPCPPVFRNFARKNRPSCVRPVSAEAVPRSVSLAVEFFRQAVIQAYRLQTGIVPETMRNSRRFLSLLTVQVLYTSVPPCFHVGRGIFQDRSLEIRISSSSLSFERVVLDVRLSADDAIPGARQVCQHHVRLLRSSSASELFRILLHCGIDACTVRYARMFSWIRSTLYR